MLALGLSAGGCYLAHEPALPSDRACVSPSTGEACGSIIAVLPEGVCRMRDGRAVAYAARTFLGPCTVSDAHPGALELITNGCLGEYPLPNDARACPDAPASGPVTFVSGRDRTATFDPPRGDCELLMEEEAAGPYAPFDEATEVCVELPGWCGAPVVIELVQPGADGCAGAAHAERCQVEVEGSRIVVDAESAPARIDSCEPALGDRVARCVVRPLATGTYDVVTADGRLLDVLEITPLTAEPVLERRCTPIAR
jgi:hypothetical protein